MVNANPYQNKSVMINRINYSKVQTSLSWNRIRELDYQMFNSFRRWEMLMVLYYYIKGGGIINYLHFCHCCYYGQARWRQKSVDRIFQSRNLGSYWLLQEKMVQDSRKMVEHLNPFVCWKIFSTIKLISRKCDSGFVAPEWKRFAKVLIRKLREWRCQTLLSKNRVIVLYWWLM